MRSSIASDSILRWARAFAALIALGTFAPATALAAGCLHPGGDRPALGDFDLLFGQRADSPTDPAAPEEPKPCTGALCSGLPGAPIPQIPNLLPPNSHWANLLVATPRLSLASERLGDEPRSVSPRPLASGLFRPPRAQAPAPAPTA